MKILLIAGHGDNDPGACSSYGVEREETRRVVNRLYEMLKQKVQVDKYPFERNCYFDALNGCIQKNFSEYDYIFEVHFNSSANSTANGTEIFVTYAENGTGVENKIVDKLHGLNFWNRGVKRENFLVISKAKSYGVSSALLEVCFISNKNDMELYKSKFEDVCKSIANGILEGFGITPYENYKVLDPKEASKNTRVKILDGAYWGRGKGNPATGKISDGWINSLNSCKLTIADSKINEGSHEYLITIDDNKKGCVWIPVNCVRKE